MSIYFSINKIIDLGLSSRASSWILEETRHLFDVEHEACMSEIYEGYDIDMEVVTFAETNQ